MSVKFPGFAVLALVSSLTAACSQDPPAQTPAQQPAAQQAPAQQAAPQQPAPTPQPPAAPEGAKPESAPAQPTPAEPALEKPARPAATAPSSPASSATAAEPAARAAEKTAAAERAAEKAAEKVAVEPQLREVTIPSGTALNVRLSTPIASDTSTIEDEVRGTLTRAIVVDGKTVVPAGTEVIGTVRDAKRSGRVKGRATIAFRFERMLVHDESLSIRTATIAREAEVKRREDVKKGAIGAAAGAIVGGIIGGGKGAAIGAGAGGAGAVVATRGEEVRLPAGTTVRTTLQQSVDVVVPRRRDS